MRTSNRSYFAARAAAAIENILAIGFEPGYEYSGRHLYPLENLSRRRINTRQITCAVFQRTVPQFFAEPWNTSNESLRFDRPQP